MMTAQAFFIGFFGLAAVWFGIVVFRTHSMMRSALAVSITGPPGGLTGVNARLRISGTLGATLIDGGTGDVAAGESADFIVNATFFLPIILGGGKMGWELRGPAVPAGVLCNGAMALCTLTQ